MPFAPSCGFSPPCSCWFWRTSNGFWSSGQRQKWRELKLTQETAEICPVCRVFYWALGAEIVFLAVRYCEDPVSKEELEDVKATKVSLLFAAFARGKLPHGSSTRVGDSWFPISAHDCPIESHWNRGANILWHRPWVGLHPASVSYLSPKTSKPLPGWVASGHVPPQWTIE